MNRFYLTPIPSAIILMLFTTLLTSCAPKAPIHSEMNSKMQQSSSITLLAPPQNSQQIMGLLELAQEDNQLEFVLEKLQSIANKATGPIKEEAAFRRVQLLLQNNMPNAYAETEQLLQQQSDHTLAAYAHFWLAKWWKEQSLEPSNTLFPNNDSNEYTDKIISELSKTLQHPQLTHELAEKALTLGRIESLQASHNYLIEWDLAAAHIDALHRDTWLRSAAAQLSLEELLALQQSSSISPQHDAVLYTHFSRLQLMAGNIETLQTLANSLLKEDPYSQLTHTIQRWATGDTQDIYIGVLLPLTGKYAAYGKQALNGIRLAMSEQKEGNIHLYIEDTANNNQAAIAGYQHLQQLGAEWIIGPLLSKHTEALLPYLQDNLPIISLSKQNELAKSSPALFIHNTAKNTQARFMANYSIEQGMQRMAIIHGSQASEIDEANAFALEFIRLGGEIIDSMALNNSIDHRAAMNQLRENSDDEELLQELISDLALFSPETELEIHMPSNLDGLYIAATGKQVSELAGQLAYVDIRDIPLLGSNRWADGHLLDDRGRNLSLAQFTQTNSQQTISSALLSQYREIWGQGKLHTFFTVAYDSSRIATLIGSRLGLHSYQAIQALHDSEGFPTESGHVFFNNNGVGNKTFHIFKIKHGKLIPSS